jgi:hypothetical protein
VKSWDSNGKVRNKGSESWELVESGPCLCSARLITVSHQYKQSPPPQLQRLLVFANNTSINQQSIWSTRSTMATQPFRFLDLPAELRFIVYEHIDFMTKHYTLEGTDAPENSSTITFVPKNLPVRILAIFQLINNEAKKFLRPKLAELRVSQCVFLSTAHPRRLWWT